MGFYEHANERLGALNEGESRIFEYIARNLMQVRGMSARVDLLGYGLVRRRERDGM